MIFVIAFLTVWVLFFVLAIIARAAIPTTVPFRVYDLWKYIFPAGLSALLIVVLIFGLGDIIGNGVLWLRSF